MIFDDAESLFISCSCIFEGHSYDSTCDDTNVDWTYSLIVDFWHIVDQIILLMDLLESAFIDEFDQLRDLSIDEGLTVSDGVPHYQVLGYCF